jgi:outer membrane protein
MIRIWKRLAGAAVLCAGVLGSGTGALAFEAGDFIVRLRGLAVMPTAGGMGIRPDLTGAGLDPKNDYVPELDFTYMITDNIGAELILATSKHNLRGTGAIAGLGTAASTRLLPPSLTLQYHFMPKSIVKPYVGFGINYTIMFDENASRALEQTLGPTTVSADNSVGFVAQAGVDIRIDDRWSINMDIKYIRMKTDITLQSGATRRQIDVDINPVIFGAGLVYRFKK